MIRELRCTYFWARVRSKPIPCICLQRTTVLRINSDHCVGVCACGDSADAATEYVCEPGYRSIEIDILREFRGEGELGSRPHKVVLTQ